MYPVFKVSAGHFSFGTTLFIASLVLINKSMFTVPLSAAQTLGAKITPTPAATSRVSARVDEKVQNGSAHAVGTNYSGLYEEGEVEHINSTQLTCETEPSEI